MKKKYLITGILFIAAGLFIFLSFRSYSLIDDKLNLRDKDQGTIEIRNIQLTEKEQEMFREEHDEYNKEKLADNKNTEKEKSQTENMEEQETESVNPEIPVLTLVNDTVEIKAGEEFYLLSQVKDVSDDKDDRYILYRDIQIRGEYNVNIPGEYILKYSVIDTDGNESKIRELKLIVKEEQVAE